MISVSGVVAFVMGPEYSIETGELTPEFNFYAELSAQLETIFQFGPATGKMRKMWGVIEAS